MVLKDLPKSVRQALAERANLSAEEAAKAADHHFDKEGRPKHDPDTQRVSSINQPSTLPETDEESDQVNAINRGRFKSGSKTTSRGFRPPQRSFNTAVSGQQTNGYRSAVRTPAPADNQSRNVRNYNARPNEWSTLQRICKAHLNYGEKAYSCEPGCQYRKQPQNKPTGNEPAGRRK